MNPELLEVIKGLFTVKDGKITYATHLRLDEPEQLEGFRKPLFMLKGLFEVNNIAKDGTYPPMLEKSGQYFSASKDFKERFCIPDTENPSWRFNYNAGDREVSLPGFTIPGLNGATPDNLAAILAWRRYEINRGYDPLKLMLDYLGSFYHKELNVQLLGVISPKSFLHTLGLIDSIINCSIGEGRDCHITAYDISNYPLRLIDKIDKGTLKSLYPKTNFNIETRNADLTHPEEISEGSPSLILMDVLTHYLTAKEIFLLNESLYKIVPMGGILVQRTLMEPSGTPPPSQREIKPMLENHLFISFLNEHFPGIDTEGESFSSQYMMEIVSPFSSPTPQASDYLRNIYTDTTTGLVRLLSFYTSSSDPNLSPFPRIFRTQVGFYAAGSRAYTPGASC